MSWNTGVIEKLKFNKSIGMSIFLYILAGIGLSFIITRSTIFESFREKIACKSEFFGNLVSCPQCFGFWSGILTALPSLSIITIILCGLSVSGICYTLTKND